MHDLRIMIIGGTGSLGKTLIRKYQDDNRILVVSRDELKHVDLKKSGKVNDNVRFKIGDVKDMRSIVSAISEFSPSVVINAAAMKHVPICEDNAYESVKVNIIGHQNVIEAVDGAAETVKTLTFISTDKACRPSNVYGMCKAISERLYLDYARRKIDTKVCVVRYGNVLESSGSVIPFFKKLIEDGADYLPITHFEMTRFLISLDLATALIDWAYYSTDSHGKIAVPKIKSMKIVDIAECLIRSYQKEDKVLLKEVGVRFGEKLHEELISSDEWGRTEKSLDNYLIGSENVSEERESFNSKDSLMENSEISTFLRENNVIK
jgi:UDP-N-acetylglucosamine 4,6-dehydratase